MTPGLAYHAPSAPVETFTAPCKGYSAQLRIIALISLYTHYKADQQKLQLYLYYLILSLTFNTSRMP